MSNDNSPNDTPPMYEMTEVISQIIYGVLLIIISFVAFAALYTIVLFSLHFFYRYRRRCRIRDLLKPVTGDGEDCAICLDAKNENVCKLKCNHSYHIHCIKRWFQEKLTCPLCIARVI